MGKLRQLFSIPTKDFTPTRDKAQFSVTKNGDLTFKQAGYSDSKNNGGNYINLSVEIKRIYQQFKRDSEANEQLQEELKRPYRRKIIGFESCKTRHIAAKSIAEEEISDSKNRISEFNNHISLIRMDPKKEGIDVPTKSGVQFIIGLILLLPITIYLMVFYISATYSAFFKKFSADSTIIESIFDSQALSKAWYGTTIETGGPMAFIFVLTIPFAFMGLGYLLHMFQKSNGTNKVLKIFGLVITTFIFDVILAYKIEAGVFSVNRELGDKFGPMEALSSVSFWAIIFAGFVVYMIWGLVLDFVLDENENKDKLRVAIRAKLDLIKKEEESILAKNKIIESNNIGITECDEQIRKEQTFIDGFIFSINDYKDYHAEYVSGWLNYISAELTVNNESRQESLNYCHKVSQNFLDGINTDLNPLENSNLE
tara:strand:+ start:1031 stop:2308 length:1278 start_codon:yes stop_codon:yes gene_type:complete